jgi:phosphohistidine swiveling domain-containing protein
VLGVEHATTLIPYGATIEIDAATGRVHVMADEHVA